MELIPGTKNWYNQVQEKIIEPERPIVDAHHHLWAMNPFQEGTPYLLEDLWADTETGHNIQKTIFIDCQSNYLEEGPEHMKPVGETKFVAEIAKQSFNKTGKAIISAIVSHANLTLGEKINDVLDAHEEFGQGLFRGIRHAGASHPNPDEAIFFPGPYHPKQFLQKDFQAGVRLLGKRGYTYESWHYHFQLQNFYTLAKAATDTIIILDHFGSPLGTKSYKGQSKAIFEQWKKDIDSLASCPNVYAKLGGLAQPDNGFGWHDAEKPATSDDLVKAQKHYYLYTIEAFGVERCMFESNFPVDKLSIAYPIFWNACKKMVADFSENEKEALFYDTASRVYKLN